MPTLSSGVSLAGTIAWSSISVRSTMVTSGASKGTFSPGWTCRLATMPDSGAVDRGVAQRYPGELDLGLVGLERALAHRKVALGAVVRGLRDEILLEQRQILRPSLFGEGELRAARFQRTHAVVQPRFQVGRIEPGDRLSCPDRLTLAHHDLAEFAGHLGSDRGLVDRLQGARHRQPARKRMGLDRGQVGRVELERDRRRVSRRGGRAIARPHDNGGGERPDRLQAPARAPIGAPPA